MLLSILCYSIMVALDFIVYMVTAVNIVTEQYQVVAAFVSVLFFYIVIMMLRLGFRKKLKSEFMGQWYILFIVSIMSVCTLFAVYNILLSPGIVIEILSYDARHSQVNSYYVNTFK